MKRILLHACCGPCATYSISELEQESFEVTLFFSNSNIHPKEEYLKRLNALKSYAINANIPLVIDKYTASDWMELTKGYETSPEGGERCQICIESRLKKTVEYAKSHGFEYFTTTLTISPHKNAEEINEIGNKLGEKHNIKFLPKNFKKRDGFKKSIEISKAHNLYRQNYCGCIYSNRK